MMLRTAGNRSGFLFSLFKLTGNTERIFGSDMDFLAFICWWAILFFFFHYSFLLKCKVLLRKTFVKMPKLRTIRSRCLFDFLCFLWCFFLPFSSPAPFSWSCPFVGEATFKIKEKGEILTSISLFYCKYNNDKAKDNTKENKVKKKRTLVAKICPIWPPRLCKQNGGLSCRCAWISHKKLRLSMLSMVC